jgi:sortase (surface protein transpeptidase)
MKSIKVLIMTMILISAGGLMQQVIAQEKTKAELEKEVQLQQSINEQKKAMADQKKAQADAEALKKEQEAAMEELMNVNVEIPGKDGESILSREEEDLQGPGHSRELIRSCSIIRLVIPILAILSEVMKRELHGIFPRQ